MTLRIALVATVALWASSGSAQARPPKCRGTLSGSVQGKFECSAGLVTREGAVYFVVDGAAPIEGVPSYVPGAFEIPGSAEARTYTLDSLGRGRASVAASGGTLYTATKTSDQRGEVTLTLASVKADPRAPGRFVVHGRYRARLIPAGAGKQGEVIVEAEF